MDERLLRKTCVSNVIVIGLCAHFFSIRHPNAHKCAKIRIGNWRPKWASSKVWTFVCYRFCDHCVTRVQCVVLIHAILGCVEQQVRISIRSNTNSCDAERSFDCLNLCNGDIFVAIVATGSGRACVHHKIACARQFDGLDLCTTPANVLVSNTGTPTVSS